MTCIIGNYIHICYIHAHYDTLHLHTFFILNSEDKLHRAQLEYETAKLNLGADEGNSAIHNVHKRIVDTKSQRYESAKATVQRLKEEINALTENEEASSNAHSNVNINSGELNDDEDDDGEDGASESNKSYSDQESESDESVDYGKNVSDEDINKFDKESQVSFDDAFFG